MHYGATRRQRVCSRTSGRGNENTVSCSLGDLLFVNVNLQNDPFALLPGDTDLVDARFALLLDDLALGTALDLVGLDSHYLGRGKGEWQFLGLELVVVGGKFLDNLLDLLLLETTHEAQGAPLERDDWGCLFTELFSRVQDRAIAANRDHKINFRFGLLITEQVIINLMKRLE